MQQIQCNVNATFILNECIYENPGLSSFYTGLDVHMNRTVGIKVLNTNTQNLQDIKTEVHLLNQLLQEGCNVPALYTTYHDLRAQKYYVVMQYLEKTLPFNEALKKAGKPHLKLELFKKLVNNIQYLHDKKIQHRDLKPQNILVQSNLDKVYLLDFNLSGRMIFENEGTVNYQAPEQIGTKISSYFDKTRVDMFAIGVMLYEAFTGVTPEPYEHYFSNGTRKTWSEFVEPKSLCAELPDKLNAVILKCMSLNPQHRYLHTKALFQDLKNIRFR